MSSISLQMLAQFNFLSPTHMIVILVVALLLFGNRLPEVARSFGRAINEFKKGMKEVGDNAADDREENPRLTNNETRRTEDGSKAQQKQSEKVHEE